MSIEAAKNAFDLAVRSELGSDHYPTIEEMKSHEAERDRLRDEIYLAVKRELSAIRQRCVQAGMESGLATEVSETELAMGLCGHWRGHRDVYERCCALGHREGEAVK